MVSSVGLVVFTFKLHLEFYRIVVTTYEGIFDPKISDVPSLLMSKSKIGSFYNLLFQEAIPDTLTNYCSAKPLPVWFV